MTVEHQLDDNTTLIIEWSPNWNCYVGTVTRNGWHNGTILRETPEEIVEVAKERRH